LEDANQHSRNRLNSLCYISCQYVIRSDTDSLFREELNIKIMIILLEYWYIPTKCNRVTVEY
jgi:hypothetical protein